MTQRNVLKATVPDRMFRLPKPACVSLLCAWARHLKTRTQRSQAICSSVLPASKTPVNQKIYHHNILQHLYPAQTQTRTKKEIPNSYIKLLNYQHPIVRFLQKMRACSRSKSPQLITTLVPITNYISPNSTDHPQVKKHCIDNFFTDHDFWATCACPEKTELP